MPYTKIKNHCIGFVSRLDEIDVASTTRDFITCIIDLSAINGGLRHIFLRPHTKFRTPLKYRLQPMNNISNKPQQSTIIQEGKLNNKVNVVIQN